MGRIILYFIVTVAATTVGAVTGMGGGVIIKPLLDTFHHYDAATINVLSSLTVLSMAIISIGKHIVHRSKFDFKMTAILAVGSIIGGMVGSKALNLLLSTQVQEQHIFLIQNVILTIILVSIFFYILKKNSLPSLGLRDAEAFAIVGLLLGVLSAFLGIGGGPINVAVIIFVFGVGTKDAAVSSLVIILFSHIAKAAMIAVSSGFERFELSMLPVMILGAVIGGLIGSKLQGELSEKIVDKMFNAVQLVVLAVCIINIIKNF